MQNAGLILTGASVSTGIASGILLASNLIVWAILAAWVGSALAFIAFGLIAWALKPRSNTPEAQKSEQPVAETSLPEAS